MAVGAALAARTTADLRPRFGPRGRRWVGITSQYVAGVGKWRATIPRQGHGARSELPAGVAGWRSDILGIVGGIVIFACAPAFFMATDVVLERLGGSWLVHRNLISLCLTGVELLAGTFVDNFLLWLGWTPPEEPQSSLGL